MQGRTIAVVEDERVIADAVAARLRKEGFEVETAADGPGGVELCRALRPDAVVLDLMLPGIDGLEVCKQIQRDRHVPVLMLTARDEEADLLVGLGVGADDYMTKPFSMQELVARLRALLRRAGTATAGDHPEQAPLTVGDLTVDPATREARQNDTTIDLTPANSTSSTTWPAAPESCTTASNSCARSGAMRTAPASAPWTPTSAACGASSAPT